MSKILPVFFKFAYFIRCEKLLATIMVNFRFTEKLSAKRILAFLKNIIC